MTNVAFVCVGNAGRSQMATAFAEREREKRGLDATVEIVTGCTDPHDSVHDNVVEALREEGTDVEDRTPRQITPDDVSGAEYVSTMGCSAAQFTPDDWAGTTERWELPHPRSDDADTVRAQRDEIESRVQDRFDRLESSSK
ncbi:low molecular weight phosphatase family protein [Natronococcus pandeyae]|uniref:Low molecular weight phosphatase family protein n=1 Tax=Natronococcus pandeyae TaxID=2055836 RepID=A0A8J8Q227_9EURY|nr:low molecular weight phosphatase family protein [Natronococcus pandeyae]TYL38705.1 low molecular weight phosphatase family protein [Natronococcus pandeyae]